MNPRFGSKFQTIVRVEVASDCLTVTFANGDSCAVQLHTLDIEGYDCVRWADATVGPEGVCVIVPAEPQPLDISWQAIRRLTHPGFNQQVRIMETRQATCVGARLKYLRESCDLTQTQLANVIGTDQAYISKVEAGKVNLGTATLSRWLKALNCSFADLNRPAFAASLYSAPRKDLHHTAGERILPELSSVGSPRTLSPLLEVTEGLLTATRDRSITHAARIVRGNEDFLCHVEPWQGGVPRLTSVLAYWMDAIPSVAPHLERILTRFSMADYLYLKFAEGALALRHEDYNGAAAHFEFILSKQTPIDICDTEFIAWSNYMLARAYKMLGRYEAALAAIQRAVNLVHELLMPNVSALFRTTAGWILFKRGQINEALDSLTRAEQTLSPTGDGLSIANIYSSYARIYRVQGDYPTAHEYYVKAIELYRQHGPVHFGYGRALCNLAFVKRLIAQERQSDEGSTFSEQMQREARLHLEDARAIFGEIDSRRGLGTVHINYGYIFLDNARYDDALAESSTAYQLGQRVTDRMLMARARILEAKIRLQVFESTNSVLDLAAARRSAEDGFTLAKAMESDRLLARAHIALGRALLHDGEVYAAKQHCERAFERLRPFSRDYAWGEWREFRSRLENSPYRKFRLFEWLEGDTGGKTYHEIADAFKEVIICTVAERVGGDPERVSQHLQLPIEEVTKVLCSDPPTAQSAPTRQPSTVISDVRSESCNWKNNG